MDVRSQRLHTTTQSARSSGAHYVHLHTVCWFCEQVVLAAAAAAGGSWLPWRATALAPCCCSVAKTVQALEQHCQAALHLCWTLAARLSLAAAPAPVTAVAAAAAAAAAAAPAQLSHGCCNETARLHRCCAPERRRACGTSEITCCR